MSADHASFNIAAPHIIVVADGDSPSAQANARGHLFERFMAKLFEAYGCDKPIVSNLNVRNNGYELDISTRITLSKAAAIAECKAYSSPLPVSSLTSFYGKVSAERLDNSQLNGWFVAIPGLTGEGHQLARKLEANDKLFRLVTAQQIFDLAREKGWVPAIDGGRGEALSDQGIAIFEQGLVSIAKQLDPSTLLPTQILARSASGRLTERQIDLLASTDYAAGLTVHDCGAPLTSHSVPLQPIELPTLATVVGSTEDFEYQFPAAPRFFIGREHILTRVQSLIDNSGCGRVLVLNAQSGWGKSSLALRIASEVGNSGGHSVVFDSRTASSHQYVSAAIRKALSDAEQKGIVTLNKEASFASLQSSLKTIQTATWADTSHPVLMFFDQFENVFRDIRLT